MALCITVNSWRMVTLSASQFSIPASKHRSESSGAVKEVGIIVEYQNSPWKGKQFFLNFLKKLGKVIFQKDLKVAQYLCHPEEPKQAQVGAGGSQEVQ